MKLNPKKLLFGSDHEKKPPVLLAVTPPRTGERTLLGVENLLQSIAVPGPFSLELSGDADGVMLMARCHNDEVVRGQIAAHYPQARIQEVSDDEDPLRLGEGEEAWGMTLRASGPDYVPLRTFRDDDLLDPGSDPLIALIGALSALKDGERIVARLLLRSLGPDWSQAHMEKAHKRLDLERRDPSYTYTTKPLQTDGVTMAILGLGALAAMRGYLWIQDGETWKAAALGAGTVLGMVVAAWGWWRLKKARSIIHDPLLIKEKVSRIAFDGELQVTAILPLDTGPQRGKELLDPVAAAYRHYDNPAGARFRASKVQPVLPNASLHPAGPGIFGSPQHPGSAGGSGAVAPAGRAGRDAPGGAIGGQGTASLGQRGQGWRSRGRLHRRSAAAHPFPRRPAAPTPPLRRKDPHGQVHPHAPRRRPQDAGEGGGQGHRRHRRHRPAHRPGERAA